MSEIKVNSVVNSTGDNDSGLDLSTNDQVIIKTANTTALTIDSSQNATFASKLATTNLGAGAVLQVVSTAKTDTFESSSTSFTDVTGLSVAITPSSSSNKILVFVHFMMAATGSNSVRFNLVRGSTNIAQPTAGSVPSSLHLNTSASQDGRMGSIVFLDSPSTTSATTYKLQALTDGNAFRINARGDSINKTSISTITVMEIAQ